MLNVKIKTIRRACGATLLLAALLAPQVSSADKPDKLEIAALSSRPDTVSGGDVLVEVRLPRHVRLRDLEITLNRREITGAFRFDRDGHRLIGLVSELRLGRNVLRASVEDDRGRGGRRTEVTLEVTNHPITGPIFSGPHQSPFICETEAFGLGAPLDANCTANTKVEYFYRASDSTFKPFNPSAPRPIDLTQTTTNEGRTVDYIVRQETGTINRAVYQIAFLHTPGTRLPDPWTNTPGWNERLIYTFGGGCSAAYRQSRSTGGVLNDLFLARGFAVASSTFNVWGNNCNDLTTAETAMMVKEYFIERFGVPRYTMGWGGSGGAMQQHMIAQNYPGILDGITPSVSYPDIFTIIPPVVDCSLLKRAFDTAVQPWTYEQKTAVAGFAGWNNCEQGSGLLAEQAPGTSSWINIGFSHSWILPTRSTNGIANCDPVVPEALIYHPLTNRNGARCTIQDNTVNGLGIDRETGFARRPLDNVGVQYGLKAFNAGQISAEQFVDLNARIGGFDIDGNIVPARTVADRTTLRIAYKNGRVNSGNGGLERLPIIDHRSYRDPLPDIHDRVRTFSTRARLIAANGHADNQVALVYSLTGTGSGSPGAIAAEVLRQMDEWLDNIASDRSPYHGKAEKAVRNKPRDLVDACYTAEGQKIAEPASYTGSGQCNQLYPPHADPRLVAGAPLANDVLKCQLKPVRASDYSGALTDAELARLRTTFPDGVCDYSRAGVEQDVVKDTWLTYPRPGRARPLDRHTDDWR